jgi:hypothetical protein
MLLKKLKSLYLVLKNLLVRKNNKPVEDDTEDMVVSLRYTLYRNDDLVAETLWGKIEDEERDLIRIGTFYHLINSGQTAGIIVEALKEMTSSDPAVHEKAIQIVQIWEYLKNYEPEELDNDELPLISPSIALTADSKQG